MKKFGFTLAEVLVTMAIIGIVAATTLPTLNANVTKGAYISKFKRTMNVINNVGSMAESQNEYTFNSLTTDNSTGYDSGVLKQSFKAVFDRYGKIDSASTGTKIVLRDGATIDIASANGVVTATIDVNGDAPPNRDFTCTAEDCSAGTVGDRFYIALNGADAYPASGDGAKYTATKWAYDHK